MKIMTKLGVLMLAAPLITGCIGDASNPDSGSGVNQVQVSGVAVDGYVAGARVYADLNNDGRRNSFEPVARTDEYGYFSFRPDFADGSLAARDYCAQGPQRHCLRVPDTAGQVRIRVEGGYDLSTGQPFTGSLSGLFTVSATDDRNVRAVTPLSATSRTNATVDGDFWGRSGSSALSVEDSIRAFQMHQSLVEATAALQTTLGDSDLTTARLVAALYSDLIPELESVSWWEVSATDLESVILEVESRFAAPDTPGVDARALAEKLVAVRTLVDDAKNDSGMDQLLSADATQLTGVTRALKAFLQMEYGPEADRSNSQEPLQWAWGEVFDNSCTGASPARIRINLIRAEMMKEDMDRDFCSTLGSGTFENLAGKSAELTEGTESLSMTFHEDGTLNLKASGIIDDFEDGAEFDGFWAQPTDDQLILTLTAFGGSFEETASINFLNEDEEGVEFEFHYLNEVTSFTTNENPF